LIENYRSTTCYIFCNIFNLSFFVAPKGQTPDRQNRRLSATDFFDDSDENDDIFVPQVPRGSIFFIYKHLLKNETINLCNKILVLFADSPGKAKSKLEESRSRRRSTMTFSGMQTIPETEEVKLTKKRAAAEDDCSTPDRKRRRASVEKEPPRTPRTPNGRKTIEPKTPESGRKTRKLV